MQIISDPTPLNQLWASQESGFTEMMKIVVDISSEVLAIDAPMHADLEELLLENGSVQSNLWGANVYPDKTAEDYLEFTSFINIRPSDNNKSMEVQDIDIRKKIITIVNKLLIR
jgi:uncharacterized protein DUF5674